MFHGGGGLSREFGGGYCAKMIMQAMMRRKSRRMAQLRLSSLLCPVWCTGRNIPPHLRHIAGRPPMPIRVMLCNVMLYQAWSLHSGHVTGMWKVVGRSLSGRVLYSARAMFSLWSTSVSLMVR